MLNAALFAIVFLVACYPSLGDAGNFLLTPPLRDGCIFTRWSCTRTGPESHQNGQQDDQACPAYAFTSPTTTRELLDAKRGGVDVQVVVDEKASKSKAATAALNILVNAGIPTRLNGSYAIHHDKYMIIDGLHVQTGSFNYSRAAAASNSEHVIVVWNAPRTAAAYAKHWQTRFDKGADYVSRY